MARVKRNRVYYPKQEIKGNRDDCVLLDQNGDLKIPRKQKNEDLEKNHKNRKSCMV